MVCGIYGFCAPNTNKNWVLERFFEVVDCITENVLRAQRQNYLEEKYKIVILVVFSLVNFYNCYFFKDVYFGLFYVAKFWENNLINIVFQNYFFF